MVDTSMYQPYQPPNPLQMYSQVVGIQNAQAGLQHQQMQNQLAQQELNKRVKLSQYVSQSMNDDGTINGNKLQSLTAQDPDTAYAQQEIAQGNLPLNAPIKLTQQDPKDGQFKDVIYPAQVAAGVMNPKGNQIKLPPLPADEVNSKHDHFMAVDKNLQNVQSQLGDDPDQNRKAIIRGSTDLVGNGQADAPQVVKAWGNMPDDAQGQKQYMADSIKSNQKVYQHFTQAYGGPHRAQQQGDSQRTGLPGIPLGYEQKQKDLFGHFNDVQNDANSVGQQNAVLGKIFDLSKSGAATGTIIGKTYQALAEKGIAPAGIADSAAQLQEITKYMHQAAIAAGIPTSDARLAAIEGSNTNPDQLPQTIQKLVPFLEATNQGRLERAKLYSNVAGDGTIPDKVSQARSIWNQHFDPRIIEMQNLQKSNPGEFKKYIAALDPQEKQQLLNKYKTLKQFNAFNQNGQ